MSNDKEHLYNPKNQNCNKNYEYIFSGCSQTHAPYISKEMHELGDYKKIWGFQIADLIKKETINLGMGSEGADSIVKRILSFCRKNGNPKVILILFPDYSRLELPETKNFKPIRIRNTDYVAHQSMRDYRFKTLENTKSISPHKWENIIDETIPLWQFLQAILILEQYCKSSNIYLRYSSWDSQTNIILSLLQENTDNYECYRKLDSDMWFNYTPSLHLKCHQDIENNYKEIFHMGSDNHHMGIHRHTHIAEGFMKEIEQDNPWN